MSSRQQLLQQQQQLSQNQGGGGAAIMFNCSRREINTPSTGFKQLFRKLRTSFRVDSNKEELSKERLDGVRVLIFGSSTEKLEPSECEALRWFLRNGGSILVMAGDGSHSATGGETLIISTPFACALHLASCPTSFQYHITTPTHPRLFHSWSC
jgi:hypothetical protein